jgi:hypothetical protein
VPGKTIIVCNRLLLRLATRVPPAGYGSFARETRIVQGKQVYSLSVVLARDRLSAGEIRGQWHVPGVRVRRSHYEHLCISPVEHKHKPSRRRTQCSNIEWSVFPRPVQQLERPDGIVQKPFSRPGGCVLGLLLVIQRNSWTTGPRTPFPPPDSRKQAVDVTDGYLFVGNLRNFLLHLPGFGSLSSLRTLLKAL